MVNPGFILNNSSVVEIEGKWYLWCGKCIVGFFVKECGGF